jgi:glycine/D-amino acid oxidase-like deaminating enzyme
MPGAPRTPHVAVIGAGAFGGWTALHLLRFGVRVTLLDAWGPGNSRASSGGETRIIRATYGPKAQFTHLAARAFELWKEHERRWNRKLLHRAGVLWMTGVDDGFERASLPFLRAANIEFEELSAAEASRRFPQINFQNVKWCIWERESGFLAARRNCRIVLEHFLAEGGEYREVSVKPGAVGRREMGELALSDGSTLRADHYVFACGPWLGKLFPDVIGNLVRPTRQEVFFFGTPPGDPQYSEAHMPAWIDRGPDYIFYGVPGNEYRGFKAGDDARGPECDPTSLERTASPEVLRKVRNHVEFRFPGLKGAPLIESRVCQYEQTPDENFIIDRHPGAENAWLVGGGSGHGYKHGPAVGELVAQMVLGRKAIDPFFTLARFER